LKKLVLSALVLVFGGLMAACGASGSDQDAARADLEARKFTVTSVQSMWPDLFVYVSFGDKGCTAEVDYHAEPRDMKLKYTAAIPGSATETTAIQVENPSVDKLRKTPPFTTLCFNASS
jgi:hypothetical protein